MIIFTTKQDGFTLKETRNQDDVEFIIVIHNVDKFVPAIHQIR